MAASAEPRSSAGPPQPSDLLDAHGPDRPRLAHSLAELPDAHRAELLEEVAALDGGPRALVDLRPWVMRWSGAEPELQAVESSLRRALEGRFAPSVLEFRRIGADAPDELLDRLTDYEAVHPIRSRLDLLRRLDPADRRCFALFHADLGDDPVVFVEVALTEGLAWSIQDIVDAPAPAPADGDEGADTATFYSITDCQPGLRGIAFGAELLDRSIDELRATTPVRTFATLSPIPGLVRWLGDGPTDPPRLLAECARYLLTAKRGDGPLDPVARFHLRNGARLERLNLGGDTSLRGLTRYLGVTANYLYEPACLAANQAAYRRGEVVASDEVTSLLETA